MIECQLYQKIKPSECLLRSREAKGDSNDNIAAIIETTNKVVLLMNCGVGMAANFVLDRALGSGYRTEQAGFPQARRYGQTFH